MENHHGFSSNLFGVIVSFDNYITENLDSNYNKAWEKYQALNASEKTEIFLKINATFERAVAMNKNIIVDFTSLTVADRKKWLDMTPKHYGKKAVVLNPFFETILERNEKRKNKYIPVKVLENMKAKLKFPLREEGFDDVVHMSDDFFTDQMDYEYMYPDHHCNFKDSFVNYNGDTVCSHCEKLLEYGATEKPLEF